MRGTRFTPATPSAAGRVPTRVARHAGGSAPGDGCRTAPSISPHLALLSSITDCRTTGLVVISATSVLARLRRYDDRGGVQAIVRIESDPVARYCGLADSGQKYHIGALGVYCQCAVVRSLTGPPHAIVPDCETDRDRTQPKCAGQARPPGPPPRDRLSPLVDRERPERSPPAGFARSHRPVGRSRRSAIRPRRSLPRRLDRPPRRLPPETPRTRPDLQPEPPSRGAQDVLPAPNGGSPASSRRSPARRRRR